MVVQLTDMKVVTKESELKQKLAGSNSYGRNSDHVGKGSYQWVPAKGNGKGNKNKDKDKEVPNHYNDDQKGNKRGGANKRGKHSSNKNWWGKKQQR